MAVDGASGAAVGLGLKAGAFASFAAIAISVLAVMLGFTVIPPTRGDELRDIARRLAGGLLCSFTFGIVLAFKAIDLCPWLLTPWQRMLEGQHAAMAYLGAAAPFLAIAAVPGFWIVAAVMRWFTRRADKDAGELVDEVRGHIRGG